MGGKQSKKKKIFDQGSIFIKCNDSYYSPGETVNGNIYLSLSQGYYFSQMRVALVGMEKYKYYYTESTGSGEDRRTETRWRSDKKKIFKQRFVIFQPPNSYLEEGQYQFPFQFILPSALPESFKYAKKSLRAPIHTDKAKIQYTLKCECEGFGINEKQYLKESETLQLIRNIKQYENSKKLEDQQPLKTCCCCNQGEIKLKAFFEKSFYYANDKIHIQFIADNSLGNINITNFSGKLLQQLKLGEFYKGNISHTLQNLQIEGISKNEGSKQLIVDIVVPEICKAEQSTTGEIVKCSYSLIIDGNIDGCTCVCCNNCCGKIPKLVFPIEISAVKHEKFQFVQGQELEYLQFYQNNYQNQYQNQNQPQNQQFYVPQQWNPQMYDQVNIQFGNYYGQQQPQMQMQMQNQPMPYANEQLYTVNQTNEQIYKQPLL